MGKGKWKIQLPINNHNFVFLLNLIWEMFLKSKEVRKKTSVQFEVNSVWGDRSVRHEFFAMKAEGYSTFASQSLLLRYYFYVTNSTPWKHFYHNFEDLHVYWCQGNAVHWEFHIILTAAIAFKKSVVFIYSTW